MQINMKMCRLLLLLCNILFPFISYGQIFDQAQTISLDALIKPKQAIATDIDSDGFEDIVVAGKYGENIIWFRNLGNGNFGNKQIIISDENNLVTTSSIVAYDLDSDNDQDIIACEYKTGVGAFGNLYFYDFQRFWIENLGASSFSSKQIIDTIPFGFGNLFVNDFNNDNFIDIFIEGGINWNKCISQSNWNEASQITFNNQFLNPYSISDIDLDGKKDVVTVLQQEGLTTKNVVWISTDGLGNLDTSHFVDVSYADPDKIQIVDFNNDSLPDVVFSSKDTIAWYKNNGNGIFGSRQIISEFMEGIYTSTFQCADLNSDNLIDILITNETSTVVYRNIGNESFVIESHVDLLYNNKIENFTIADFDNDGYPDLLSLLSNSDPFRIVWLKNLGEFEFSFEKSVAGDYNTFIKKLCDLDSDGDLDILTEYSWYENKLNSDESFSILKPLFKPNLTQDQTIVGIADINGDSNKDILIKTSGCQNSLLGLINDGNQNFVDSATFSIGFNSFVSIQFNDDLDNNGFEDIVFVGSACNNSIIDTAFTCFYSNLDGTFSAPIYGVIESENFGLSVEYPYGQIIDYNLDGFKDLILTADSGIINQTSSSLSIVGFLYFQNSGNGSFLPGLLLHSFEFPIIGDFYFSDIDNDDDLDILFMIQNGVYGLGFLYKCTNNGNNIFSTPEVVNDNIPFGGFYPYDFDSDGDADLICNSIFGEGYQFLLLENQNGVFVISQLLSDINNTKIFVGDLDGDSDFDLITDDLLFGYNFHDYTVSYFENKLSKPLKCDQLKIIDSDQLILFPNPIISEFSIDNNSKPFQLIIFDCSGAKQYEKHFIEHENTCINLDLDAGLYIIQINQDNGQTITKKVVKIN